MDEVVNASVPVTTDESNEFMNEPEIVDEVNVCPYVILVVDILVDISGVAFAVVTVMEPVALLKLVESVGVNVHT